MEDTFEDTERRQTFAWEGEYDRPWESLEESSAGRLTLRAEDDHDFAGRNRRRRQHDLIDGLASVGAIKRRMLRAVLLIVDASKASSVSDFKPTRLVAATEGLIHFVKAFFDENPLSSLGVLCTRRGKVERLCEFSKSSKTVENALLALQTNGAAEGSATLQNVLDWAASMFRFIPDYVEREVIIVASAMSVVDPGDVYLTMKTLREKPAVRCSTIHLCGLVEVYKRLADHTLGTFSVAMNAKHLQELLADHITPPVSSIKECYMVQMGFPSQRLDHISTSNVAGGSLNNAAQPAYCMDTTQIQPQPYYCPRCKGAVSSLPATCRTCQLSLIASSHLARSHHHLFPVDTFTELSYYSHERDQNLVCSACQEPRPPHVSASVAFFVECPKCKWKFCRYCDDLIHDTLFVCPGCVL
jgi:transcription initiation factor TFIIH subunit 2